MDSSGIGLVMGRYQLMQTLGGEMALSNLPASIKRVMRLAGLDRLAVLDKPNHRQSQTVQNRQLKSEEDFHTGIEPVSYTHLDVYKRQTQCGAVILQSDCRASDHVPIKLATPEAQRQK